MKRKGVFGFSEVKRTVAAVSLGVASLLLCASCTPEEQGNVGSGTESVTTESERRETENSKSDTESGSGTEIITEPGAGSSEESETITESEVNTEAGSISESEIITEPETETDTQPEETPAEETFIFLGAEYPEGLPEAEQELPKVQFHFQGADGDVVCMIREDGDAYALQNGLTPGRTYVPVFEAQGDQKILTGYKEAEPIGVTALTGNSAVTEPATLKKFLSVALEPVGTTLYVYGGGWNWQDTGSAKETRTLGLSTAWKEFFLTQNGTYDYQGATYPKDGFNTAHALGLDCSGFVGWTLYNTLHTENDLPGYVGKSTTFASTLAQNGWGSFETTPVREDLRPGDIISIKGHVWICLGKCSDNSILLVHSTPSASKEGVKGGGVSVSSIGGEGSVAAGLASKIMKEHYPLWSERYDPVICSEGYLSCPEEETGRFRFLLSGEDTGISEGSA
ncbi:MAG: hypothetical protein J5825_00895, partial [Lachnospiraceae bacterium]|nr:hypothetical protein [Lachnospiraceae bacterium]